jgi:cardiolipin synthase
MIHWVPWVPTPILTTIHVVFALAVTLHVLWHKREIGSTIAWMGLAWLSPLIGSLLYLLFGINRVHRKAHRMRRRRTMPGGKERPGATSRDDHLIALERAVGVITNRPLLAGNDIKVLRNGDEAYPAMIAAIDQAKSSLCLASYIFDDDAAGAGFIAALIAAKARGVEVRVLIDGIGSGYLYAPVYERLRASGVAVARFLHSLLPWRMTFLNLRNHRKILVIDGHLAFLGGINIGAGNLLDSRPADPIRDVHFRISGPVIAQITEAFVADWYFTTGEELSGDRWYPPQAAADDALPGSALARIITSGPDQDIEKLNLIFLQAIGCARQSIKIATPYFLPEEALISALGLAAMRGVAVDIVIPAKSDHRLTDWAILAHIGPLLKAGVRISRASGPFEHSKLFTVDESWALVGSANWDTRSMRLNFEITLEVYDAAFATEISRQIEHRKDGALTLDQIQQLPWALQLRNLAARLMLPYL